MFNTFILIFQKEMIMGKKKMSIPELSDLTVKYIPAQVYITPSNSVVRYFVVNPSTEKLHRKEIRLNRVKSARLQKQWGLQIAHDINVKLANGWNPFYEQIGRLAHHKIEDAIECYIKYKERDLRPASMVSYVSLSGKLLEWWKRQKTTKYISSFTSQDAQRMLDDFYRSSRNITARTYNNYLKFYKTMFTWFVERDYIKDNPFNYIKIKRVDVKKRITIPRAVREKIKEYFNDDPYFYVCELVYHCFLRPKEITMLQIKHIDYENRLLEITSEVSKNRKGRYVPIPDNVFNYFCSFRWQPADHYIFGYNCMSGKNRLQSCAFSKRWDKMRKQLNLPMEYQLYSLKDTGITEMLEAGVPAKLVQELADHHSLDMTQKYVHKSNVKEILKYDVLQF